MEARSFVLRGVLAGGVAGLVAWLFALVFAEPQIDAAIAYEEGRGEAEEALAVAGGAAPAGGGEEEIVSRGVQATLGVGIGMVGIGIAVGLLFAVAYTLLHGRVAPAAAGARAPGRRRRLPDDLRDAVRQVPREPAGGGQRRDHRRPHRAVPGDGDRLAGVPRRRGRRGPAAAGAPRDVERRPGRRRRLRRPRGDPHVGAAGSRRADDQRRRERPAGHRDAAAAAGRLGGDPLPGLRRRRPLLLPRRVLHRAGAAVGRARSRVRRRWSSAGYARRSGDRRPQPGTADLAVV